MALTDFLRPKDGSSAGKFWGWHTIYPVADPTSPYMTRIWFGRLRLHVFHRGDMDKDAHDHPWGFWTFPLTPYVEEVVEPDGEGGFRSRLVVVRAFRPNYRPATHCHRVLGSFEGFPPVDEPFIWFFDKTSADDVPIIGSRKIVTLLWREKSSRSWGFLKNREGRWCWQAWREYVFEGGKNAPCGESE